ncbi:MAG: hypothetical protein IKZ57_06795 [Spirochaetia bacterium]|nr:hypothetical protein [Spirochaetia bacterium]
MKSKFYIIASILAVICLICSCGGGGGSADGEAQKVGALSFSVVTDGPEKVLSITNPDITTAAVYQYTATPSFNTEFGTTPQGTQTTWKDLTMNTARTSSTDTLYFAQGNWSFEVRVIIKGTNYDTDATDFTLLYKTAAPVTQYINAGSETDSTTNVTKYNNVVEVTVVRQIDATGNATGTLNVNGVTAPAASDADDLVITYGRIGADMTQLASIDSATVANGLSTFTNNSISVAPGIYVMKFTVKDKYGNEVGATTKTVEIVKNVTTPVTGSIDAGKWVATSFTVKGVKTITCSASITATSFDQGDTITITFSGYISDGGTETAENITYYFCDGMNAPVSIGSHAGSSEQTYTYNWVTTSVARGYWYPCIIAADSTGNLITNNTDPTPLKVTIQ